jgi:hypothetical protein
MGLRFASVHNIEKLHAAYRIKRGQISDQIHPGSGCTGNYARNARACLKGSVSCTIRMSEPLEPSSRNFQGEEAPGT